MKPSILFALCLILAGCGSEPSIPAKPVVKELRNVTITGDSMAAGFYYDAAKLEVKQRDWWLTLPASSIDNKGISGAPLESVKTDNTQNVVVLFAGFNNIKHADETVEMIVAKYRKVLSEITADKIICIGVPFMDHSLSDPWFPDGKWITEERIQSVNDGIRAACPAYIDVQDVKSQDGVHPQYGLIIERLEKELR